MKTRITLAMACFIGLVLCSAAVAYIPALIVRECPHCKAFVLEEQTVSGNTIGATFWTDGKREAKMLPDHPELAKCPKCSDLYWIQDAVEVDSGFDAAKGKQWVLAPSEAEMLVFLADQTLPKEKEFCLRLHAWWAANDVWRWAPGSKPNFSKEQVRNLDALAALLDESKPGERILKAEIERELGRFDECLRLLSFQFDEGYDRATGFIRKLAEEKVQAVRPFERGK